ncbi:hypothetical protein PV328_012133 [Microctonus aethiopoides]|uniref:Uncharacterized protein n=1 Tax=Microctonus aethiopoides TaxID=144406 RepID=A0AA39C2R2_9HYME|nr:hypothetical protein PV328_012133 [Microctonus aethiopoides]
MPGKRRGASLGRQTHKAALMRNRRDRRTEEEREEDNANTRVAMARLHQEQPEDTRAERNEQIRLRQRQARRFITHRERAGRFIE